MLSLQSLLSTRPRERLGCEIGVRRPSNRLSSALPYRSTEDATTFLIRALLAPNSADCVRPPAALGSLARWSMVAAFAVGYSTTGDGLFVLLAVVAAVRALDRLTPEQTDLGIWLQFTLILAALWRSLRLAAPAAP